MTFVECAHDSSPESEPRVHLRDLDRVDGFVVGLSTS